MGCGDGVVVCGGVCRPASAAYVTDCLSLSIKDHSLGKPSPGHIFVHVQSV